MSAKTRDIFARGALVVSCAVGGSSIRDEHRLTVNYVLPLMLNAYAGVLAACGQPCGAVSTLRPDPAAARRDLPTGQGELRPRIRHELQ